MSLFNWFSARRTGPRPVRPTGKPRPAFRPRVEQLEDRVTPANYSVGTVPDLIAAMSAANLTPEADTIALAPATRLTLTAVNNSTHGPTGLPMIAAGENLTILGGGGTIERSAAAGAPAFRLFDVAASASLRLENLTLQGGLASVGTWTKGGAIHSAGDLSLRDVVVQNNRAQAPGAIGLPGAGGGIYSSGALVVEGGAISNNQAIGGQGRPGLRSRFGGWLPGGPGGDGLGGGLYVSGPATLTGVTLTGNTAVGGPGGTSPGGGIGAAGRGHGGGVYVSSGAIASLDAFTVAHVTGNHPDNVYDANWPTLSISNATVTEGNSGTVSAVFTVTLSAASAQPVTVNYATKEVNADAGDYVGAAGTLTFAPGETVKTISIAVNGDTTAEADEVFDVWLSNAFGATLANSAAAGIIVNDDAVLPTLKINDVSKNEGRKGTTNFTFTVTLSEPAAGPVTVHFATADGTATTSDNDYVAQSGTLTFAAGETSKTITVAVKGDKRAEANEYFWVELSGAVGALLDPLSKGSEGIGKILNDD